MLILAPAPQFQRQDFPTLQDVCDQRLRILYCLLMKIDLLLNDFSIRCFRDIGDGDYIAARIACRAALVTQYVWASQQAIEKYLKCVLLLNRIPARDVQHDLGLALSKINRSGKLRIDLTKASQEFIDRLDRLGRFRYLEISNVAFGVDLINLDRVVWELRRYCTLTKFPDAILRHGFPAPLVRIPGGHLEKIIDDNDDAARAPLLWQNAFFGRKARKKVRLKRWFHAHNSPLYLHPELRHQPSPFSGKI
jgi:hypothetical protein